jgi:hypothetical protein
MSGARAMSRTAILSPEFECIIVSCVVVYSVVDDGLSPEFPLSVDLEVFIHGEDAERFIEEVQGDDPEVAANLRIEERELEVGGLN